jgi:hypothetical protein
MLLDLATWCAQLRGSLGHPVVRVYMTDEMLRQQIQIALRKIAPYTNAIEVLHVTQRTTTYTDKQIYGVLRVTGTATPTAPASSSGLTAYDYLLHTTHSLYGSYATKDTSARLLGAAYQAERTDTLAAVGYRVVDNTLYLDGGHPPYTVEALTSTSVQHMDLASVAWAEEYALALTQLVEGEIRSKVQVQGSPLTLNGAELKAAGAASKSELESQLGSRRALYYWTR